MKSESRFTSIIVGLALLFACAVAAQAQNREKFVISAKAGGVNLVSGNVTVQRKDVKQPEALTENDNLETGDSVTTGAGGRIEVLLNPGTYLRVNENSEFELGNASLDNLRVKLVKGSALVEAMGDDETRLAIAVNTPQTEVLIVKRGIYRFNVLPNDVTEIAVRKGRALLGLGAITTIKEGQKVLVGRDGHVEVSKLDKKDEDAFDLWSKQRAEFLAKANQHIQPRTLLAAFNNRWPDLYGFNNGFGYGYNTGYWFYSPTNRSYCFVPHGGRNWTSPYGHQYHTGVGFANPGGGGRQGWTHGNGSPATGNGSSGSRGNNPSSGSSNPSSSSGSGGLSGNSNPMPASQPVSQPSYSPPTIERSIAPAAESHIDRANGATRSP